jgi:hypothetical protein
VFLLIASYWLENCANFTPTDGGKRPIQRQPLLVQYKQQASPRLSMHNYTLLVISGNAKKHLTLLCQRKLALTASNSLFALCNYGGAPKKFKKWPCPLVRPKTNHTCHQKPHPSRETVPLKHSQISRLSEIICK